MITKEEYEAAKGKHSEGAWTDQMQMILDAVIREYEENRSPCEKYLDKFTQEERQQITLAYAGYSSPLYRGPVRDVSRMAASIFEGKPWTPRGGIRVILKGASPAENPNAYPPQYKSMYNFVKGFYDDNQ